MFGQFHPSRAMLSHSQSLARLAAACANRFSTSTAPAFFWNKDKTPSTTDKNPEIEGKAFQFDLVVPGRVSPQVRPDQFPRDIRLPVYAESGVPGPSPRAPQIHGAESAAKIRRACRIARKILDLAGKVCHMS